MGFGYIIRYGHTGKEKYYIIPSYASDLYSFLIDKNTICQCTGLKDKNGRRRKKVVINQRN
jgi:hypothetical protein